MASLRAVAQQVLEEARDGIAWIALYRKGRGWEAGCFWPTFYEESGIFTFDSDDTQEVKSILATDPEAIFVNGYYTNLGPLEKMTRETLSAAFLWQYKEHINQLAEAV